MTGDATTIAGQPRKSLWTNVSFLLMWSSVAASGFADQLIQLAAKPMLGVRAEGAGAASIQAGITFFFLLPYMGMTLVGGWLADRLPRKWIMLGCDESRAAILLLAFFMAYQLTGTNIPAEGVPRDYYWRIYLIMALTGAFAAIFNPAKQSTLPQIVPLNHLPQANAVLAGITMISSLIGLVIGGALIDRGSVRIGILTASLAYGISGIFFAFLKVQEHTKVARAAPSIKSQVVDGFSYIVKKSPVRNLVILNIMFWSAAWIVMSAIATLNRYHYDIPVEEYISAESNMKALLGGGILCASLFVLWLKTLRESGVVAMGSLFIASIAMVVLALNRNRELGLVLTVVIGFFGGVFFICIDAMTQAITANHVRGRVFGLRALLNTISAVVLNFAIWRFGSEADKYMLPALLATAGALLVVAAFGAWTALTAGRHPPLAMTVWRLSRLYMLVWHRMRIIGKHNIPREGPVILAANHTTGIDPMLMQGSTDRIIRWLMLAQYRTPWLNWFWKINQPICLDMNSGDVSKLKAIVEVLNNGEIVGIFPEGRLQREHRDLGPFEPGVGMMVRRSEAVIVPVWITGTPRTQRMMWHFLRPSRSTVIFGPPYRPDSHMKPREIADDLRERMIALSKLVASDS